MNHTIRNNTCKRLFIAWYTALSISCAGAGEDFVIKKQESRTDKNSLKISCGNELGESLKATPDILRKIADIQEHGFQIVELMWEGDFFQGASKEALQEECKHYAAMNNDLEEMLTRLENHKRFLMSQKKKYQK